jgi:hypothetical protein
MIQWVIEEHYFDVVDEFHDVRKQYYYVSLKTDIENLKNINSSLKKVSLCYLRSCNLTITW